MDNKKSWATNLANTYSSLTPYSKDGRSQTIIHNVTHDLMHLLSHSKGWAETTTESGRNFVTTEIAHTSSISFHESFQIYCPFIARKYMHMSLKKVSLWRKRK